MCVRLCVVAVWFVLSSSGNTGNCTWQPCFSSSLIAKLDGCKQNKNYGRHRCGKPWLYLILRDQVARLLFEPEEISRWLVSIFFSPEKEHFMLLLTLRVSTFRQQTVVWQDELRCNHCCSALMPLLQLWEPFLPRSGAEVVQDLGGW